MRYLDADDQDDPMLSVVNVIDVFLVIIGILLIVMLENPLNPFAAAEEVMVVTNPGREDMEIIIKQGETLEHYQATGEIGEGQGVKAGVAYRLPDGSMIYVPE
ncbi:hypothetical protein CAI21_13705 [Alkalilimnicola ehrlichii]|uniref:DUF2149 domain-containing protein n=1 Tax=Alkalilimnicola ehrlichii TaxID=351052 RepID=A0A3E0WRK6_9GAMM|nr:DUF2149 domain-containing protein [Alkalilimnicola ehrlichii]RFA27970.1 hypothetical protein CAI21_13705 [Alkalilimnicola ehrlichii]RFA34617.1 hypothetical protein CAL65_14730 [Alkalilimnicola ehrlichii]